MCWAKRKSKARLRKSYGELKVFENFAKKTHKSTTHHSMGAPDYFENV